MFVPWTRSISTSLGVLTRCFPQFRHWTLVTLEFISFPPPPPSSTSSHLRIQTIVSGECVPYCYIEFLITGYVIHVFWISGFVPAHYSHASLNTNLDPMCELRRDAHRDAGGCAFIPALTLICAQCCSRLTEKTRSLISGKDPTSEQVLPSWSTPHCCKPPLRIKTTMTSYPAVTVAYL